MEQNGLMDEKALMKDKIYTLIICILYINIKNSRKKFILREFSAFSIKLLALLLLAFS